MRGLFIIGMNGENYARGSATLQSSGSRSDIMAVHSLTDRRDRVFSPQSADYLLVFHTTSETV